MARNISQVPNIDLRAGLLPSTSLRSQMISGVLALWTPLHWLVHCPVIGVMNYYLFYNPIKATNFCRP